jgi:hypothetical protein
MAFEIHKLKREESMADRPIATRRLYYNVDKTMLVEQGDQRARTLACAPGDPIPELAVAKKESAPGKAGKQVPNKAQKPAENKESTHGGQK